MNGYQPNTPPRAVPTLTPPPPGTVAPSLAQQSATLLGGIKVELENINGRMDHLFQMIALAAEGQQTDAKAVHDLLAALAGALAEFLTALPATLAAAISQTVNQANPTAGALPAPTPAPAESAEGSTFQTIDCTYIVKTTDEQNRPRIAVKGGQYQQYGIPVYEEYWPRFGIDPAKLPGGTSRWDHRVLVEMKISKSGKIVPARAVGFAANDRQP
jgi:hypothetical protein